PPHDHRLLMCLPLKVRPERAPDQPRHLLRNDRAFSIRLPANVVLLENLWVHMRHYFFLCIQADVLETSETRLFSSSAFVTIVSKSPACNTVFPCGVMICPPRLIEATILPSGQGSSLIFLPDAGEP